MRRFILLFILIVTSAFNSYSQNFGIMVGGGATWYYGDMNDRVITHEKLIRPYVNAGLLYRLSNRFDIWASFMHGELAGDDSLAIKYAIRNRNLSFNSSIDELSLNIGYRILGDRKGKARRVVPYIFVGIGGYHFKPKAEIGGSTVDLQSVGTEGQYIEEGDYPAPYELYQLSVPAGLGVEFALSKAWKLRLEAGYHFLFTDYLDDVSGDYADSASLAASPNGTVAVLLASQIKDASYPSEGTKRGSSKVYDSFAKVGLSVLWTPFKGGSNSGQKKKKKKSHCPAYH